jgi:hypothetical protein
VRRCPFHGEAGERRIGRRNVWHNFTGRQRRRRRGIGAVFFVTEAAFSARLALFASSTLFALSIAMCAAFLSWMRRAVPSTRSQNLTPISDDGHNPAD